MKKYKKGFFTELRFKSDKVYEGVPALNWGEMKDGQYLVSDRYDFKWKISVREQTENGEKESLKPLGMSLYDYIIQFRDECLKQKLTVEAFIGTDSQNHTTFSRFVTALCLRVQGNGVHVIINRQDLTKMYDFRYRLLREADITAEFMRNHHQFFRDINMPIEVHSDYNEVTNHKSSNVVTEAINYMGHLGFKLIIKPNAFGASYAADHFC